MKKNVLITGGAGFIGSHLMEWLITTDQYTITCLDNFEPFYDPALKRANIARLSGHPSFRLVEGDIADSRTFLDQLDEKYDIVVHLAAKAGVRPSLKDPVLYQHVNVVGLQNILEIARQKGVKQFVFGSSSSVYGVNPRFPWKETEQELMP
jgi:UDP-glucuronate 4-epimerase